MTSTTMEEQESLTKQARAALKGQMVRLGVRGPCNLVSVNSNDAFKGDSIAQEALKG